MLEGVLSLILATITLLGGAWIIDSAFQKLKCEERAFKRARLFLERPTPLSFSQQEVKVIERCSHQKIQVTLPLLEKGSH